MPVKFFIIFGEYPKARDLSNYMQIFFNGHFFFLLSHQGMVQ
jgi:hypothetical protein